MLYLVKAERSHSRIELVVCCVVVVVVVVVEEAADAIAVFGLKPTGKYSTPLGHDKACATGRLA